MTDLPSAADSKFLHHLPHARSGTSNRKKQRWNQMFAVHAPMRWSGMTIRRKVITFQLFISGRIFCGKPVPTFPENAPAPPEAGRA
jgi:hypothetical protein